ncbi:MAG: type VI secretion system amidase effector protein Tae4 [Gammaproteobacteria bacterium]|nr:type VI secretion system amidase effector protein Tae4 [Gammaproteobacteria bacterium]
MARPSFQKAWTAFARIYGDGSLQHVSQELGGKVAANIDGGIFENACAIRMSYVLNQSGYPVTSAHGATVSAADNSKYLFRVRDLEKHLRQRFGKPEVDGPARERDLAGDPGLLLFTVGGWSNATGHATVWNGRSCADRCYFPQSSHIAFWKLP